MLHCTLGDVAIAAGACCLVAALTRNVDWPLQHPWRGAAIVVAVTALFTVWREWYNVYRLGHWTCTLRMPTLLGIGPTPLLQWVVLPPLIVATFQALHGRWLRQTLNPLVEGSIPSRPTIP